MRAYGVAGLILMMVVAVSGCAIKRMGSEQLADAISATSSAFASDNDPEFVRLAAPSTLKMVEMLLLDQPRHHGLLSTACSGFTQYAYAFLHVDADSIESSRAAEARELRRRAARMYDRAREYCLRALDVHVTGIRTELPSGKTDNLRRTGKTDVHALYWLGASWGGSLTLAETPATRIGEIPVLRAVLQRALDLDPGWESGAIHEAMIALEGLPPVLGGSPLRAREHFDKAVQLSGGDSAFAYVTLATSVAQPARDRAEFERLLRAALAVDVSKRPSLRLPNLVAQKRARALLARIETMF
jgi:predicted anti-sigma-YlaC factor YlaD